LLPFAIQFSHAHEKHEYLACNSQDIAYIHQHKIDCSVFHFQVNHNTIAFPSNFPITEKVLAKQNIYSYKEQIFSVKLYSKSSRAPPFYCFN